MADEVLDQIKALGANVEAVKVKADKVEALETKADQAVTKAAGAEATAREAKSAADNAATKAAAATETVESFKAWQVKKDERDAANQEVINKHLADGNRIQMKQSGGEDFSDLLNKAIAEATDVLAKFAKKEIKEFSLDLKATDMTFSTAFSNAASSVTTVRSGLVALPNRKRHIRTLLPIGTMEGSSFTYLKEVAGAGAPAAWGEASGTKTQFDLGMTEAVVQAEYIAGFLNMSKKLLEDVKGFTSFLNMRLPELLLKAEDTAILTGNGTSPNISGITHAGNFIASDSTSDIIVERLIDAITQLEELDRDATAALVRPAVYGELYKNKASGSGEYDLPSNVTFTNGTLYVGGVPVFATTAMDAGKFIVGDFQSGIQLLVREAPSIVFAYEDVDNIRKNRVTVRIEERIALPIYGNNYFVYGDTVPVV